MKNKMKICRLLSGLVAAGCALGLMFPMPVAATVSDADFNALKDLVQQMNKKLQSLEQTNQAGPADHPAVAATVGRHQKNCR